MKFLKPKIYRLKNQNNWTLAYVHPETQKRIRKRFEAKRDATIYLNDLVSTFIQEEENFLKGETLSIIVQEYVKKYPETKFFKIKKISDRFMQDFGSYHPKEITPYRLKDWFLKLMEEENYSLKALSAEFPERVPANFLNGYHLISSKGTTQFPIMGTIF